MIAPRSTTSGATRGVERRLLPPTGYEHTLLDVVGLQRSVSLRNLSFVPKLIRSTYQAIKLIRRLAPKRGRQRRRVRQRSCHAGGDVAPCSRRRGQLRPSPGPGLEAARRGAPRRVPWPTTAPTLPRATLTGRTGSPRGAGSRTSTATGSSALSALDLPGDRFVFGVFGGSLGAKRLNDVTAEMVESAGRPARSGRVPHRRRAQSGRRRARSRWQ